MPYPIRMTWAGYAEAFAIFAKYEGQGVCAEHDEIFAGPDPSVVTEADKKRLIELGWNPSEESFHKFT